VTRFILVRHGETEWNREARIQGQRDSALTIQGRAQAVAIAERLATERFDAIVSSDLGRAMDTAARIAMRCGRSVTGDSRLRERCYGEGEGMTYEDAGIKYPEAFSRQFGAESEFAIPGGESRRQFQERVARAFDSLAGEHPGARLVVVTHGGVLASIYRRILGIALTTPHKVPIANAAFNEIAHEAGAWNVAAWDDTAHLATVAEPGSILTRMS
jgi:probable phosphoglycerate mutase